MEKEEQGSGFWRAEGGDVFRQDVWNLCVHFVCLFVLHSFIHVCSGISLA